MPFCLFASHCIKFRLLNHQLILWNDFQLRMYVWVCLNQTKFNPTVLLFYHIEVKKLALLFENKRIGPKNNIPAQPILMLLMQGFFFINVHACIFNKASFFTYWRQYSWEDVLTNVLSCMNQLLILGAWTDLVKMPGSLQTGSKITKSLSKHWSLTCSVSGFWSHQGKSGSFILMNLEYRIGHKEPNIK